MGISRAWLIRFSFVPVLVLLVISFQNCGESFDASSGTFVDLGSSGDDGNNGDDDDPVPPPPPPPPPPGPDVPAASVIFADDFETGNLSKSMGGARWGSGANVSASSTMARGGQYSARFFFRGTGGAEDSTAELRFDLGRSYQEVWIRYDLYTPTNYTHRFPSDGSNNNKFFRLWDLDYDSFEKVGASTWVGSNGSSSLQADWNMGGQGIGPKGPDANIMGAADRGKWSTYIIQVKAATSASQHGTLRIWKDDVLIINNSNTMNNYAAGQTHAYRYGYLMGWSNSGYSQDTYFYIDNVLFATSPLK